MRAKTTKGNDWEALSAAARRVSKRAYAPHSGLHVGAALLGRKGGIFAGCNVENASLGLTICAEQSALFRAIAEGEREFAALAIYTPDREPLSPCGACRQVLAEFAPDLCILSVGRGGKRVGFHLRELLPHAFDLPPRPLDEQENAS